MREWKEIKPTADKPESSVRCEYSAKLQYYFEKQHVVMFCHRFFALDKFLTDRECDEFKQEHEARLKELQKHDPIFCFADENAMQEHLAQSKVDWAGKVTASDFLSGL